MEYVSGSQTNGMPIPPGVTAITDLKNQKRANKTLSKAVSLHLEGKLEGAATKFDTIYTGTQILPLGSCTTPPAPEKEMVGGCTHNVSGDGIQGVIRFYDVIPTVGKGATNFFYEGVLTLRNGKSAAIAPVVPEPFQAADAGIGASQRQLGRAPMAC